MARQKPKEFNKGFYDRLTVEDKKAYMSTDPIMSRLSAKKLMKSLTKQIDKKNMKPLIPVWEDRDVKKRGSKLGG